MNTIIAAKRPKVTVENIGHHRSLTWESHLAECHVEGCDWSYENIAKTDVEDQARRHREAHRHAAHLQREFQVGDVVRVGKGAKLWRVSGFLQSSEAIAHLAPLEGYSGTSVSTERLVLIEAAS